jgi:hypothetical protein
MKPEQESAGTRAGPTAPEHRLGQRAGYEHGCQRAKRTGGTVTHARGQRERDKGGRQPGAPAQHHQGPADVE